MKTAYLAPQGLESQLERELKDISAQYDRLFIAEGPPQPVHWAQNIWFDPQTIPFRSISDAAQKLRQLHGLWAFYPYSNIRRAGLIRSQLPYFSPKPLLFPSRLPEKPLGSWTLLDANTLLASPRCASPFSNGEVHFQENKSPPSRAYLKLWELFTKIGRMPNANETCLEIGASPGSWTWVLQPLCAKVIAVDRAPLAPSIATLPNISFLKQDAFALKPSDFNVDWLFSDVICYPDKLLEWIQPWIETNANLVCTIKFQGTPETNIIDEFEKIPGSHVCHLFHNKHELTWVRLRKN